MLFRANKEAEACELMFSICGTPKEDNMPGCTKMRNYPSLVKSNNQTRKLKEYLKRCLNKQHLISNLKDEKNPEAGLTEHWFDLIDKMLLLDPAKRLTGAQALKHPFFTDPSLE